MKNILSFDSKLQNSLINISIKNRYVWYKIPKVASTLIEKALMEHEIFGYSNFDLKNHPAPLNSPFIKPYQLDNDHLLSILNGEEFFKFTVVRHPYSRFLSSYLDKVVGRGEFRHMIGKALGIESGEKISFEEFTRAVVDLSVSNRHWMPQCHLVGPKLDAVLKIETLSDDIKKLPRPLDVVLARIFGKSTPHITNSSDKLFLYYNKHLEEKIYGYYKDDFLKYSFSKFT